MARARKPEERKTWAAIIRRCYCLNSLHEDVIIVRRTGSRRGASCLFLLRCGKEPLAARRGAMRPLTDPLPAGCATVRPGVSRFRHALWTAEPRNRGGPDVSRQATYLGRRLGISLPDIAYQITACCIRHLAVRLALVCLARCICHVAWQAGCLVRCL